MGPTVLERGISVPDYQTKPAIKEGESFHDGYVFRLDYSPDTPDAVLQNDVITYLEEYRLQVKKNTYNLLYTKGSDGQLALRSSDNGDSMLSLGKNAVNDRAASGKPVAKEVADLLGMQKIQEYMAEAEEGETVLWASPPDPTVGYEYGFFYIGEVKRIEGDEKKLKMSAIRLDKNPSLKQFNSALSILTQSEIAYETVNEFISNPQKLQRSVSEQELDFVLKGTFEFEKDSEEELKKQYIREKLQPVIEYFKTQVREGASKEMLRKTIFALENYSLKLNAEYGKNSYGETVVYESPRSQQAQVGMMVDHYSFIPPKVVGSCDVGSGGSSPSILGYSSIFNPSTLFVSGQEQQSWSYSYGDCRLCDKFTEVGPCKICKTCEKKFN